MSFAKGLERVQIVEFDKTETVLNPILVSYCKGFHVFKNYGFEVTDEGVFYNFDKNLLKSYSHFIDVACEIRQGFEEGFHSAEKIYNSEISKLRFLLGTIDFTHAILKHEKSCVERVEGLCNRFPEKTFSSKTFFLCYEEKINFLHSELVLERKLDCWNNFSDSDEDFVNREYQFFSVLHELGF
jgi:hypothetical protein